MYTCMPQTVRFAQHFSYDILSPYLFTRYIRELIAAIISSRIGCNIGGSMVNSIYYSLKYADDIMLFLLLHGQLCRSYLELQTRVLLILIWHVMRIRLFVWFAIINAERILLLTCFLICVYLIRLSQFRYIGHIIDNQLTDNEDIKREIRNLSMRTNLLHRRFNKCSIPLI